MKRPVRNLLIGAGSLLLVGVGGAAWLWSQTMLERPMRSLGDARAVALLGEGGVLTTLGAVTARGRPTVVSFWASWCVPCRDETRALVALRAMHPASALSIISINIDPESPQSKRDAFLSATGGRSLMQLRGQPATYRALTARSLIALPTVGFFDRAGRSVVTTTSWAPATGESTAAEAIRRIM